jgi:hypothetical protein
VMLISHRGLRCSNDSRRLLIIVCILSLVLLDGRGHFDTSELAGNVAAAGISNVYYAAADRSFGNTANKRGQQIALDALFILAEEFWPGVRNKLFKP